MDALAFENGVARNLGRREAELEDRLVARSLARFERHAVRLGIDQQHELGAVDADRNEHALGQLESGNVVTHAVEHELVANSAGIESVGCFERARQDGFAAHHRAQPFLLLHIAAKACNRKRAQRECCEGRRRSDRASELA